MPSTSARVRKGNGVPASFAGVKIFSQSTVEAKARDGEPTASDEDEEEHSESGDSDVEDHSDDGNDEGAGPSIDCEMLAPEMKSLGKKFCDSVKELRDKLTPLITRVRKQKTVSGLSYLEVKNHFLLAYCTRIAFFTVLKASGRSVKDHPVINALVELRTILEKLKPVDQKLNYQVNMVSVSPQCNHSTTISVVCPAPYFSSQSFTLSSFISG